MDTEFLLKAAFLLVRLVRVWSVESAGIFALVVVVVTLGFAVLVSVGIVELYSVAAFLRVAWARWSGRVGWVALRASLPEPIVEASGQFNHPVERIRVWVKGYGVFDVCLEALVVVVPLCLVGPSFEEGCRLPECGGVVRY